MAGGVIIERSILPPSGNFTLMKWGRIEFQVWPLNFHEYDHTTQSDYARKDVMASSPQREWTGEGDEEITLRGRIFPYHVRLGNNAMPAINAMDGERRRHTANMLIRGASSHGDVLGWYVIDMLNRHHTLVGNEAVGRVVNFDARFLRVDIPDGATFANNMLTAV